METQKRKINWRKITLWVLLGVGCLFTFIYILHVPLCAYEIAPVGGCP